MMPHVITKAAMVLSSAIVLLPHSLRAEENAQSSPSTTNRERQVRGRNHFEIGLQMVREGRWADALVEFDASLRNRASAAVMRNRALCLEQLGRHQEAAAAFRAYLDLAGANLSRSERAAVERQVLASAAQLASLTVRVNVAGAEVFVNGSRRGVSPLVRSIEFDAGVHYVEVRKQGYRTGAHHVTLSPGESSQLSVELVDLGNPGGPQTPNEDVYTVNHPSPRLSPGAVVGIVLNSLLIVGAMVGIIVARSHAP
jgi:hypothetical protein